MVAMWRKCSRWLWWRRYGLGFEWRLTFVTTKPLIEAEIEAELEVTVMSKTKTLKTKTLKIGEDWRGIF
jgi:hypothetical protein